jgi:predicted O-methyltransferase YrrM
MAIEDVSDDTFQKIRQVTSGMLSPKVYKGIFEAALDVRRGVYLDIGPAQGGSTISIALARRAAERADLIYSADVFTASNALKTSDVDTNVGILQDNLAEFGLGSGIKIIVVGRDDISTSVPLEAEIGLFFVDADGALDRDFEQFYDRIVPGGVIILDDYENKIIKKYVEYTRDRLDRYVKSKGAQQISELTPLGKHYSVYKFTNKLVSLGLMEQTRIINNTVFLKKTGVKTYKESGALQAMVETRDEVAGEFFRAREIYFESAS